ncbi:hypothetical protein BXZ70DRAFT_1080352 [Cristinia sonorae]|uniref:Uncharacterized protein n=1 Tax=Cristinia sonorae TaxID=1940300 RepID=A0A8K0UGK0_9AGAR|nr:hypothetical protein BXZ70DRAFT_1080352 [Cristinia sonorae]
MPRGGEGGTSSNVYLVHQQGHSPSYQQAPTDSRQLQPKNLKESDRRPAARQPRVGEEISPLDIESMISALTRHSPAETRGKLQQLEEGIPHCRKGGEVSINWMMRKGKVLSRAVKRKYKKKKENRNSVK